MGCNGVIIKRMTEDINEVKPTKSTQQHTHPHTHTIQCIQACTDIQKLSMTGLSQPLNTFLGIFLHSNLDIMTNHHSSTWTLESARLNAAHTYSGGWWGWNGLWVIGCASWQRWGCAGKECRREGGIEGAKVVEDNRVAAFISLRIFMGEGGTERWESGRASNVMGEWSSQRSVFTARFASQRKLCCVSCRWIRCYQCSSSVKGWLS